jgi:hypothetical protein
VALWYSAFSFLSAHRPNAGRRNAGGGEHAEAHFKQEAHFNQGIAGSDNHLVALVVSLAVAGRALEV